MNLQNKELDKKNPCEFVSHLNSQKTQEILFNYGLALYQQGQYELAFKAFDKSSSTLKAMPKLWYYMGLCVLNLNK